MKRVLLGPENGEDTCSRILLDPKQQDGSLVVQIFQLISSMSESGLTEVSHYISMMDVQRFHQINLREIGDTLSNLLIRT